MLIDNYAYTNKLRNVHPGEKLAFALITMAIGFIPNLYVHLVIIFIIAVVLVFKAGIPARVFCKLLFLPFSFLFIGILTIVINPITEGDKAVMAFKVFNASVGITQESLRAGGLLFFRTFALISCFYFLSLTTSVVDLMMVLKRFGVPAIFLELMHLIYRFLFVLMETAERIYISQCSRLGYSSLKTSFYSLGMLTSSLFTKAYRDAEMLHVALEARGYDGELNVLEGEYCVSIKNIFLIMVTETMLLLLALNTGGSFR
jgi:cobalt/nickel transport system permease protein